MVKYYGMMGKNSSEIANFMFILGIFAALGLRLVTILWRFSENLGKSVWYISLIIYSLFYLYRINIEQKRRNLITKHRLREKLLEPGLGFDDRRLIARVLDSVMVSKLGDNFRILFIMSVIAILVQFLIDFLL